MLLVYTTFSQRDIFIVEASKTLPVVSYFNILSPQSTQNNLKQHLASVLEEIRQTKKVKYNIENDLAGKEVAMDIDHQTSNLKVTGPSMKVPRYLQK